MDRTTGIILPCPSAPPSRKKEDDLGNLRRRRRNIVLPSLSLLHLFTQPQYTSFFFFKQYSTPYSIHILVFPIFWHPDILVFCSYLTNKFQSSCARIPLAGSEAAAGTTTTSSRMLPSYSSSTQSKMMARHHHSSSPGVSNGYPRGNTFDISPHR